MKSIMISIRPEWVEKILNGSKIIEIRKTMPKCKLPCKVYIYCTKDGRKTLWGNPYIENSWKIWQGSKLLKDTSLVKDWDAKTGVSFDCLRANGKVVAEFTLNAVDEFKVFENGNVQYWNYYDLEKSCLTYDEIFNYVGRNKIGYAWHIDDLKIYDEPKELSEFKKANCQQLINKLEYTGCDELYCNTQINDTMSLDGGECDYNCCPKLKITRPPQSWCYVEEIR